jgi:tetratricopeptide (TPR) repeat protein
VLLLLFVWGASAGPLEAGMYEQSIRALRQLLATQDGPPVWARLGQALSRAGRYQEALEAFEFGQGQYYDARAIPDHATALRAVGRCEEAMALRSSARWLAKEESMELALTVGLLDDALYCKQLALALTYGEQALTLDPESASAHAGLADVYLALGEPDEAEWYLQLAQQLDPHEDRVVIATLRALLAQERWQDLSRLLPQLKGALARQPAVFVAKVQLALVQARIRDAMQLYHDPAWRDHEDHEIQALREAIAQHFRVGFAPSPRRGP